MTLAYKIKDDMIDPPPPVFGAAVRAAQTDVMVQFLAFLPHRVHLGLGSKSCCSGGSDRTITIIYGATSDFPDLFHVSIINLVSVPFPFGSMLIIIKKKVNSFYDGNY